jgi:hypothetical protein
MVATKKQKSLNDKLDALLSDVELPSEQEIKEETRRAKIRESSAERWKDPVYNDRVSAKIKQSFSSEEMREVQAAKFRGLKVSEQVKQRLKEHNTGKQRKGQDWIADMAEKKKGNGCHNKPFLTPSGAFPSKKQAVDWATKHGVRNAAGKFDAWLKIPESGFKYISNDEYKQLKDQPLKTGLTWMLNISKSPRYKNEK